MSEPGEGKSNQEIVREATPEAVRFEFKDAASAEEYLTWKQEVPLPLRRLVESAMRGVAPAPSATGLPLTDEFLSTLTSCFRERDLTHLGEITPRVAKFLQPLARIDTKGGYLNLFETLTNPEISWKLKQTLYETQIKAALEWLVERDLQNAAWQKPSPEQPSKPDEGASEKEKKENGENPQNDVPSAEEDTISSMEAGAEKKEGEPARALFSVNPFFGGYYRQVVFSTFNSVTLHWEKDENELMEATGEKTDPTSARILSGKIRGGAPLALPLPYDWVIDPNSLETSAPEDAVEITRNQEGLWYLSVKTDGIFTYTLRIAQKQRIELGERGKAAEIQGVLPDELLQKIKELKASGLPKIKLKREIVKFVRAHLTYSNSRDAYTHYAENPSEYFTRMWERKEADCKVANDLACRVLAEIDNNFRYVTGFYVKEKGEQGEAMMHAGNGHAWLEIWDAQSRRYVRLDATPKGDPMVDEKEQEQDLEGETGEGDYGAPDEELASEEETKEKLKELKKKETGAGGGKGKRKSPEFNVEEEHFAELAECTPAQAQEFFKSLERVREIKNEQGVPISDLLKDEWRKIVEERKIEMRDYRGPVRMDEGDRLEDPVSAVIDIRAGEFNPTGFEKDERVEKTQMEFGGINLYFSFDLSGSMRESDPATGRSKADVQRDVALLLIDSIMQCAYIYRQEGEQADLLPLKIMVTLATDTGKVALPLTDRWGPKEQWAFYAALTKLASGGTPTHQTLKLIERDFDKERAALVARGIPPEKLPLHYTAEISDGSPDDFDATERMHGELKAKGMAMRSYVIGAQSGSADAAPPLASFSELPNILAQDILTQFKKLRPRKVP